MSKINKNFYLITAHGVDKIGASWRAVTLDLELF